MARIVDAVTALRAMHDGKIVEMVENAECATPVFFKMSCNGIQQGDDCVDFACGAVYTTEIELNTFMRQKYHILTVEIPEPIITYEE